MLAREFGSGVFSLADFAKFESGSVSFLSLLRRLSRFLARRGDTSEEEIAIHVKNDDVSYP